ncbi:MAG: cupin domain-containing protein [Ruminococcaceae bacterium]|nr:cupin domain-containing protein [Oscillospiraceae bacterium]
MKTSQFIHKKEGVVVHNCHGGVGPFVFYDMIEEADKMFIRFIHDDIIPPKSTFGYHQHKEANEEEWYYCVSGSGIMQLDGEEIPFNPGDICVCRTNGWHGLINNGTEDLRIIVICASSMEEK